MSIDPSQIYNPWNPFGPTGGLFSPFGSYFMPPTGQGQSLAPYSQQTWYGFNPWGGAGAGAGATPLNLWSLYQQLFPAGNALAGYSFMGAPQAPPPITTAGGTAFGALPPFSGAFPPVPTPFASFTPPTAPATAPALPLLAQPGGGGEAGSAGTRAGGIGSIGGVL